MPFDETLSKFAVELILTNSILLNSSTVEQGVDTQPAASSRTSSAT